MHSEALVFWKANKKFIKRAWLHHRAYFSLSNLYGANLSVANLSRADLSGANLSGSYLYGANLYGANLSGADLYGANLSVANLSVANLYGANLSGSYLSRANLSVANLSVANLYGEKIDKIPIQLSGLKWWINITKKHIQIGCQVHEAEKWFKFKDYPHFEITHGLTLAEAKRRYQQRKFIGKSSYITI